MPFTPFHLGPALLLGLLLLERVDLPTFLAANVLTDWRAALVFLGFWPGPRHSWMHTYFWSLAAALLLAASMQFLRPHLDELMESLGLNNSFSLRKIVLASLTGVVVHVTLDAFHHPTMHPLWPLMEKPLYGVLSTGEVRAVATVCMAISIPIYYLRSRNR